MYEDLSVLPSLLVSADGKAVRPSSWEGRRAELLELLSREVYGPMPAPVNVTWETLTHNDPEKTFAGKIEHWRMAIQLAFPDGPFVFPLDVFVPRQAEKPPLVLHVNFRAQIPDRYLPVEEIADRGFAIALLCFEDITADNGDFTSKMAAHMPAMGLPEGECGKISMWAYAACRALDFLVTLPQIDTSRIAVAGHSRLGKTALWAGANDSRFYAAFSNDSGCTGAGLSRGRPAQAESIAAIINRFPYWFCSRYAGWAGREEALPFDQHFLVAALAPRRVYVASAAEDIWACPPSEYAACRAASSVWGMLGYDVSAFSGTPSDFQEPFCVRGERIGYHLRRYGHFFSRYDWNCFLDFLLAEA